MDLSTAVVVPSYRSWQHLERHLPVLLAETEALGVEVVVIDDASPDDTAERVEASFPGVRVIRRAENGGFGANCNEGVAAVDVDFVFLMNADVRVEPGFLQPLVETLSADRGAFAVSSVALDKPGGQASDGPRWGYFARGHLKWRKLDLSGLLDRTEPVHTLYAVGAHVLLRREVFLELGGFDELYAPYYWEDVDLCYRAWKRGWRVLCDPRSRVVHDHGPQSDIERTQGERHVATIIHRNRFLFLWKNLHDRGLLWRAHLMPVLLRAAFGWLVLDGRFYRPLWQALGRLGQARRARRIEAAAVAIGDRQLLLREGAPLGPVAPAAPEPKGSVRHA